MTDHNLSPREAEEKFESTDSDEELLSYLETLAPQIGWIVIYFNSLEDMVSQFIRDAMLHDSLQDERMDIFLSEMMFAAKCRSLMHLYGQMIEACSLKVTQADLKRLEEDLQECSKRRNEYAHADWIGLKKGGFVKVKSQSKKLGIVHRYKHFDSAQVEDDIHYICNIRDELENFNEHITNQLYGRG